ncbi:MAG: DUF559 domain-containing protein, partial [Patescibacteria group bacterium]|nr:DUF559 domain-containing protein [Patescibacteria group bacterium]
TLPPLMVAGYVVAPQLRVGPYWADFGVLCRGKSGVLCRAVIECDGHTYHERTPEQAAHDRARDRHMQASGIMVLRYTAAEIQSAPLFCATSALTIIEGRASV